MQYAEARHWLQQQLQAAGTTEAAHESLLLLEAAGISPLAGRMHPEQPVSPLQQQQLAAWLARRQLREPLQYILGEAWFYGLRLEVSPAVLIPRPETEELVEKALQDLPEAARVADIGTGSGAIALALAAQRPDLTLYATDISTEALAVAQRNAAAHHLPVHFLQGDALDPLKSLPPFDLLISNPPYIPEQNLAGLSPEVQNFEPRQALTPGSDALHFYRIFALDAPTCLSPHGKLWVELEAPLAQATAALFTPPCWQEVSLHQDLSRKVRFLRAVQISQLMR